MKKTTLVACLLLATHFMYSQQTMLASGGQAIGSGNFTIIDWSADSYFIKTETDLAGGTTYATTGTNQLLSVPYGLYAKTSGNGVGPEGPEGAQGTDGAPVFVYDTTYQVSDLPAYTGSPED